ncbi:beta-N-acetylhexosaminidase [Marinilabiliaceae bacterium JC017]|nr:beta-N-acetylhexosaminidase [Marinilabiliaceae bacterium JC017]
MKNKSVYITLLFVGLLVMSCTLTNKEQSEYNIIPLPKQINKGTGEFTLNEKTTIVFSSLDKESQVVVNYMVDLLRPSTGFELPVVTEKPSGNFIELVISPEMKGHRGVYHFNVTSDAVIIRAPEAIGLFYGIQTMRQMLPVNVEHKTVQQGIKWNIPAATIIDEPRFKYRGLHLDVGRHFFPVSFIKKNLDLLALHKMNVFHWHLTEDQGWRIEIKKYPKLMEVASQRKETLIGHGGRPPFKYDGKPYGGYYTQEEVKEVVAYAKERFITVIPEIELPGHSQAALAAYPYIGCTGGPYETATRWGVFDEVFCAGNEQTFKFLEDVLTEVIELFPSEYIHIGGDECPKTRWKTCKKCQNRIKNEGLKDEHELQSYFIHRIENFLLSKGRRIIGWDEILEGGLAPEATVMSWRGEAGGIEAAKQGHDVIMTPNASLYFDHYQTDPKNEPLAIGGFTPLEDVYAYDPIPAELTAEEAKYVLGAQANVWTEYMKESNYVEYMVYPRACALAEVCWTPLERKDWRNFRQRMENHFNRLKALDVNYFYEVPKPVTETQNIGFIESAEIALDVPVNDVEIRYTIDNSEPSAKSLLYSKPVVVKNTGTLKAITIKKENGDQSEPLVVEYEKLEYLNPLSEKQSDMSGGLKYTVHEGNFKSIKEIVNSQSSGSGKLDVSFMPADLPLDSYGLVITGHLLISQDGVYQFSTTSDDGSALYLSDKLVVNNDGLHGAKKEYGNVALNAGLHPVRILYFQAGGGQKLEITMNREGEAEKFLTPADFKN